MFADDIFKYIVMNEDVLISITISTEIYSQVSNLQ